MQTHLSQLCINLYLSPSETVGSVIVSRGAELDEDIQRRLNGPDAAVGDICVDAATNTAAIARPDLVRDRELTRLGKCDGPQLGAQLECNVLGKMCIRDSI